MLKSQTRQRNTTVSHSTPTDSQTQRYRKYSMRYSPRLNHQMKISASHLLVNRSQLPRPSAYFNISFNINQFIFILFFLFSRLGSKVPWYVPTPKMDKLKKINESQKKRIIIILDVWGGGGGVRDGSVNLDGKTPVGVSKDISWKNETWQCWYCVYIFSRQGSDNFQVCIR